MATRCVEELHVFADAQTQQAGPHRDSDPVQALGERWTRNASKHAAASHMEQTGHLDGPAQSWSDMDHPLVLARRSPHELAASAVGQELVHVRELSDGLGIDL
jgi:hypothetical protein